MNGLPEGWAMARLEDLTAAEPRAMTDGPFGSNLKTEHYTKNGPRVIRLQNVGFGEFVDEHARISRAHFEKLRAHEAKAGDLVVASLGQDLPRSCLIPDAATPAIVKADCIRIRLHPEIDARYVNYGLQRPALRRVVSERIHGVGRPRLGMDGVRGLEIPVAPTSEQHRIADAIEEYLARMDGAESQLRGAALRLGYELALRSGGSPIRRAILGYAFSGRLVPQDSSDEPASDLLERVRAERAAIGPKRRRRAAS